MLQSNDVRLAMFSISVEMIDANIVKNNYVIILPKSEILNYIRVLLAS